MININEIDKTDETKKRTSINLDEKNLTKTINLANINNISNISNISNITNINNITMKQNNENIAPKASRSLYRKHKIFNNK